MSLFKGCRLNTIWPWHVDAGLHGCQQVSRVNCLSSDALSFSVSLCKGIASCSSRTMNSIYAANTCSKGMGDLHMFYMCMTGCDHFMTNTVCHICVFLHFRNVQHSQWDLINTGLHRKKTHDSVKISRKNISITHNQRARLKRPTSPPQHSSAGIIRNAFNFSATITITKWHYLMELILKRCTCCLEIYRVF